MLMNKESHDAIIEQQTREIKNLKSMQKSERKRAIKIIKKEWNEVNKSDIPDRVKSVVYTFKQIIVSKITAQNDIKNSKSKNKEGNAPRI